MQKLIQETVQYTTPDKVDQNDKTGLLEKEETAGENTGSTSSGNGGAAGADATQIHPRYTGPDRHTGRFRYIFQQQRSKRVAV